MEATMFAQNDKIMNQPYISNTARLMVILLLFQSVFKYLRRTSEVDTMVACFHPRHAMFYRAMQFKKFGDMREYESVKNNPALAYVLDLDYQGDKKAMQLKEFFGLIGPKQEPTLEDVKTQFTLHDIGEALLDANHPQSK